MAVLFSDADNDGHITSETEATGPEKIEVLQRHFYYHPSSRDKQFGMDNLPRNLGVEGPWHWPEVEGRENRYQYNEKEFNGDLGLGWNDYGARWYNGGGNPNYALKYNSF